MTCPYCKEQMGHGYLKGFRDYLWWIPKNKFFHSPFSDDSLIVEDSSTKRKTCVIAYVCTQCHKVIANIKEFS